MHSDEVLSASEVGNDAALIQIFTRAGFLLVGLAEKNGNGLRRVRQLKQQTAGQQLNLNRAPRPAQFAA
jgi:hypothetical protein